MGRGERRGKHAGSPPTPRKRKGMIRGLDRVALPVDKPELGLRAGDMGTVVHVWGKREVRWGSSPSLATP